MYFSFNVGRGIQTLNGLYFKDDTEFVEVIVVPKEDFEINFSDNQVLAKFEVIPDFTKILSGHEKRIRPDYLELFYQ